MMGLLLLLSTIIYLFLFCARSPQATTSAIAPQALDIHIVNSVRQRAVKAVESRLAFAVNGPDKLT